MPYTQPDFGKETQAALTKAKLGTIDVFIAPVGTLYNAATGWKYLGRTMPGSYKNDFSKKFYDVMTGVPETTKESFVTGMEAKVEFSIMEPTSLVYQLASGSSEKVAGYDTTPLTGTTTTASTTDTLKMTAAIAGLNVGDEIEVGNTVKEYTFVTKISGTDIEMYPKLTVAPASGVTIKRVATWEFGMGGSLIQQWAIRAVFHAANDGSQIVTWVNSARSEGVKDDFKDNKSQMEIPLSFTLFGYKDPNFTGPIVAKKYLLTAGAALQYN